MIAAFGPVELIVVNDKPLNISCLLRYSSNLSAASLSDNLAPDKSCSSSHAKYAVNAAPSLCSSGSSQLVYFYTRRNMPPTIWHRLNPSCSASVLIDLASLMGFHAITMFSFPTASARAREADFPSRIYQMKIFSAASRSTTTLLISPSLPSADFDQAVCTHR